MRHKHVLAKEIGTLKFRKVPSLFPPEILNVHDSSLLNIDRTNNETKGFNNRFSELVTLKQAYTRT